MKYLIELINQIYAKGYGFVSFAKSPSKSLRCKYGQNFLDTTKKSAGDALKIASKRVKI